MKNRMRILLAIVFFTFVAAGLAAHIGVLCCPDHPYSAQVRQAFLAEGGQVDEPIVTAWAQSQSPD